MIKIKIDGISEQKLKEEINKQLTHKREPIIEHLEKEDSSIDINEILQYSGKTFIEKAYEKLLGRKPDLEGLSYYLSLLKSGVLTKKQFIALLYYSEEGRQRKIKVKGTDLKLHFVLYKLQKLPVIRTFLRYVKAFLTLPSLERKINSFENFWQDEILSLNHKLYLIQNHFENEIKTLNHEVSQISKLSYPKNVESILIEKINYPLKENLAFYNAFEEIFRGESYTVKDRLSIYKNFLPDLKDYTALDLGCGRGEFLKLLNEEKINCVGVDTDKYLTEKLKSKGYKVENKDAIAFLQNTQEKYGLITAFHLIEHLNFENQQKLIKLSFEKLQKNGKIIIETPNPYFLHAFGSFYIDPTHIKPIPPETLTFIMQWYGFKNIEVLYLNPFTDKIPAYLNTKSAYMDYAVIGER